MTEHTSWVSCTDCNRVLWTEDGPTCPECLAKRVPVVFVGEGKTPITREDSKHGYRKPDVKPEDAA